VARAGTFRGDLAVAAPDTAFVARSAPAPRIEALAVHPEDGKEAWVGAWGAGVFRTTDGGVTWQAMGLVGFEVSDLAVDFRREVAYVGTGSGVYTLRDWGTAAGPR